MALAEKPVPSAEDARLEIMERLAHWQGKLAAFDRGTANETCTRREIVERLDTWLDRLLELRGS